MRRTIRALAGNKAFSLINITGLALGTLCCLYIVLYVMDQYGYDKHWRDGDRVYRVNSTFQLGGNQSEFAAASPPTAVAMKNDFPEVEDYTRVIVTNMAGIFEHLLRYKDKDIYEENTVYVDSTFFNVFNYRFIEGNPATAMQGPYTVVLLQSTASKLFGEENPLGKVIDIESPGDKHSYTITGVVAEKGKSHIQANLFIGMNAGGLGNWIRTQVNNEWAGAIVIASYIRVRPHTDVAALERKLPAFQEKYGGEAMKQMGMTKQLHLQPIATIHTHVGYDKEFSETVNPRFLNILLLIAFLIQGIACINFMNLSTARAAKRAREVGVRKVIGAGRKSLVLQFLGESMLMTLTGILLALPLLVLFLPFLNGITRADVSLSMLASPEIWLVLLALVLGTGLVAGSYPAFYLSGFQPIRVIKGNFRGRGSALGVRRSLVVFQFSLAIVLIIGIIVMYKQMAFMRDKDLGYNKDRKLVFSLHTNVTPSTITAITQDFRNVSGVDEVSKSDNNPAMFVYKHDRIYNLTAKNIALTAPFIKSDEHFVKTLGINLVSGRDFRENDDHKILINETMARGLGLDPLKAPGILLRSDTDWEVVGVMKDFNFTSLKEQVKPLVLWHVGEAGDLTQILVSTRTGDMPALLDRMKKVWARDLPGIPFVYSFMDAQVNRLYETETTQSEIIDSFTAMAILISCLGLFGLAAFSAERRTKEIGIRKVLGAGVTGLVGLLTREFLVLVGISILIAVPFGWWAMHQWLQAFVYRVSITPWMFALAGSMALLVALATVSFQALRAAMANPVKSLRAE